MEGWLRRGRRMAVGGKAGRKRGNDGGEVGG